MDGFLIVPCELGNTNAIAVLADDAYLVWWVGNIVASEGDQVFTWDPDQEPRRVPVSAVMGGAMFSGDGELTQAGAEWFGVWLSARRIMDETRSSAKS